mmetsp:Transcript_44693/g.91220  ORF Transcript_44693/g.91220 Transcript_44693/m.91220 type:complete len:218 (-) Transcript_44693:151-804(-)|eukprot:CAMPEP_0181299042 /NCGR_PEP_ID=MMETSP1101-20121128/6120_1 /TAXON_ID=46948 /ORGANISM="Rhodomonas abbreviata, Strain Caron Lab Isolate" /LENGTH=217 /DNA_ID=CAMNT_0023404135 /DNA_START=301 /DNA_END=954 /DNA_ORIENTATION=-
MATIPPSGAGSKIPESRTWLSKRVSEVAGEKIRDVLYWEDPKMSGIWLTAGFVLFFLKMWCRYSWATLISGFLIVHLFQSILRSTFYSFDAKVKDSFKKVTIDVNSAKSSVEKIVRFYNSSVDWYCELAAGKDVRRALEALGCFIGVWMLTYFLSDHVQALLGFVCAFSLPKVYEIKHEMIDEQVTKIKEQAVQGFDALMKKIPSAVRKNEPKPKNQ